MLSPKIAEQLSEEPIYLEGELIDLEPRPEMVDVRLDHAYFRLMVRITKAHIRCLDGNPEHALHCVDTLAEWLEKGIESAHRLEQLRALMKRHND